MTVQFNVFNSLCIFSNLRNLHIVTLIFIRTLCLQWFLAYSNDEHQLGTFSVNGEWVCGGLFAVNGEIGPTGAEHVARSQLNRYVLFLIQSVIIKCEIQCSYKRVITLLNNVYLTASYIHAHCDRACVRTQLPIQHSIPNDNHSDLKRTSSIMISKSYRKFTTFPTGDYSVFFMEDFLSNKDSSDKIIGQSPVGNIVNFAI